MKKIIAIISIALVTLLVILFGAVHFTGGQTDYQEAVSSVSEVTTTSSQSATTEHADDHDHSDEEYIVVKISDDAYVTAHGDHYHYYNGQVPADALFSKDLLMTDSSYTFSQDDVVSETDEGYIIKVGDTYYLYLKDQNKQDNVR